MRAFWKRSKRDTFWKRFKLIFFGKKRDEDQCQLRGQTPDWNRFKGDTFWKRLKARWKREDRYSVPADHEFFVHLIRPLEMNGEDRNISVKVRFKYDVKRKGQRRIVNIRIINVDMQAGRDCPTDCLAKGGALCKICRGFSEFIRKVQIDLVPELPKCSTVEKVDAKPLNIAKLVTQQHDGNWGTTAIPGKGPSVQISSQTSTNIGVSISAQGFEAAKLRSNSDAATGNRKQLSSEELSGTPIQGEWTIWSPPRSVPSEVEFEVRVMAWVAGYKKSWLRWLWLPSWLSCGLGHVNEDCEPLIHTQYVVIRV